MSLPLRTVILKTTTVAVLPAKLRAASMLVVVLVKAPH